MDKYNIFLLIKGTNVTILADSSEDMTVREFQQTIACAVDKSPEDIRLYYNGQILEEPNTMMFYNLASTLFNPVTVILTEKLSGGDFEDFNMVSTKLIKQQ